jgi:putative ABC transport system permease protein
MNLASVAVKNALRNRVRTFLTVAGVAVAILGFVMLRTVLSAWTVAADYASKDRIGTRHKVTFVMTIPKKYVDQIRQIPGVKAATFATWFGGKIPGREQEFFANLAIDHTTALEVYDEMVVTPEAKARFFEDRQGCLVGHVLAKKMGWKEGDKITLESPFYPTPMELHVSGIYTASRKSIDVSTVFFRFDYLNDSLVPERQDQIGWVTSLVTDPTKVADISLAIDKAFEDQDVQTLSMSERAMQMSFLGMVSAVLKAIDIVSLVILVIMMLILGNTIAMGVRERTNEYGVLRAIGFKPGHLATFILGEAAALGLVGGLTGLAIAYPLVEKGIGAFIEENMGSWFPYFRIAPETLVAAPVLAIVLAVVAAMIPAYRASKLEVTEALRRLG